MEFTLVNKDTASDETRPSVEGGSQRQSIDEGSVEFKVDPASKKLVKKSEETAPEFVTKPRRQFINEGETAKYKATFDGSPDTTLVWSKDGKALAGDNRFKIHQDGDVHLLEITKVTADDQGTYTCTIQNTAGSATAAAELEVFVRPKPHGKKSMFLPPTVDVALEDTEFANGEKDATLICKFSNAIDGRATWFKDGREINNWQTKTAFDGRTAKLTLREAAKKHCGTYECVVKNTGGEARTKALVSLLDPSVKPTPPKFLVTLNDQTLDTGEKLVLEAEVTGLPRPSLKWYKDNTELGSSQDIRMEYKNGKGRLIMDVSPDEASTITCVAQNVAGKEQTQAAVQVVKGSEDLREPPIFTKELHDMEVDDGDRVELGVEVKGTPPIDIVWVHNNREIPPTDPVCRMVANGNSRQLIIPEVFPEDAGEYVCEAYNDYGDTDTFCRVLVREKQESPDNTSISPEFVIRPQSTSVTKGNSAIFTCRAAGHPPPTVSWCKDKEPIRHRRKYKLQTTGDEHSLEVTSVTVDDVGQYICTLTNEAGEAKCAANLYVGETTATPPAPTDFRAVLHPRSNASHPGKPNSTDSDRSDISLKQDLTVKSTESSSKKTVAPIVDKKGGVQQVDFRNVLKKHGIKEINEKPDKQERKPDFRSVMSQREQFSDKETKPKASLVNSKPVVSKDPVLSKTEGIQSGKQVDFRSVLKRRKENDSSLTPSAKLDTDKDNTRLDPLISIAKKLERSEIYNKPAQVESKRKPEFKSQLEDQSVKYGSEVVLQCAVEGSPEPDIAWSMNEKIIKKSKFFRMSYENQCARLVIAEAFSEDEGEYTCLASNTAGSVSRSCNLHVQASPPSEDQSDDDTATELFSPDHSPPKIYDISPSHFSILRGGAMEFRTSYSAVPRADVRWMKNKVEIKNDRRVNVDTTEHFSTLTIKNVRPGDSGRYNVQVENDIGFDTASASLTVQDVPEPPVGMPSVSDVTLTSVTLSWYGPAYDGGCPVTNYRVEMCDAEDQIWTLVTSSCKNTTYHIDKLTPNTPYFFRVFAENRHGISQACQTSDVTVTCDKRPSMLRTLSVESDDVFAPDVMVTTPMSEYDFVSPLSPDELPFEHREVKMTPGRVFEDIYERLEEVGKGKFGSVYRCREKISGGTWAAKIIKYREADKPKIRLEVEIMNQLKHPKILMLWDVFEVPRRMILVMEYIGGGELFERVLDDGFELMERDCIQFMRQICDAVSYMHSKNILHLDLKPENILCIKNESNKIKIIDFGLARFYKPGESTRVMFGTPEFVAPEVVNYEEIGFMTDMWSLGVICYVLLSGLSPFMGDSDSETLSNVTQGEFDFEDESFESISNNAKDFINSLLLKNKRKRMTAQQCLEHKWLAQDATRMKSGKINTKNLKRFMARRKWQKTGKAILALGRITGLQRAFKQRAPEDGQGSGGSGSSSSSLDSQCQSASSATSDGSSATLVSDSVSKVTLLEEGGQRNRNGGISKEFQKKSSEVKLELDKSKRDINSNDRTKTPNMNLPSEIKTSRFQNENSSANQTVGKFKWTNQNVSDSLNSNANSVCSGKPAIPRESVSDTRESGEETEEEEREHQPGSPQFTKEMIDSKAFPGDAVRFDVVVDGEPEPEIEWYFEEDLLKKSPRHMIQHGEDGGCSLIIKDVTEEDDGEYSCRAVNSHGEAICTAELIVYGTI